MQKSTLQHNSKPARVTWLTLILDLSFPQRCFSRLAGATRACPGCTPSLCSTQLVPQRIRLVPIIRVKAFGKPITDLGPQARRFVLLALPLPEAAQARHAARVPLEWIPPAPDAMGKASSWHETWRLLLGV